MRSVEGKYKEEMYEETSISNYGGRYGKQIRRA